MQVELTYYDSKGNLMNYDNYTHSVQSSQFTIEESGDSLNIVYTLGRSRAISTEFPNTSVKNASVP